MTGFDVTRYLAIPWQPHGRNWSGCDCWGLCRLVLQHERGVVVPSFVEGYNDPADVKATARLYKANTAELGERIEREEAEPFDAILMRTQQEPVHIGIISSPGKMLHMRPKHGVANVNYASATTEWSIIGFYRWIALRERRMTLPIVPNLRRSAVR